MLKKNGFTLLEILIAMVIIGILSSIVIPQYQVYVVQSKVMSAFASLNALKPHIEQRIAQDQPITSSLSLEQLGGHQLDQKSIGNMTFNYIEGTHPVYELQVTFISEGIADHSITLQRKQGAWSCTTDLPSQFQPTHCKAHHANKTVQSAAQMESF
tara:strand:- start:20979 stop:21446 length:468 start_codon:yes stop_codon:yes gene_type:complete